MADLGEEAFSSQMKVVATFLRLLEELMRNKQQDLRYGTKTQRRGILGRMKDFVGGIFKKVYDGTFGRLSRNGKDYGQLDLNDPAVAKLFADTMKQMGMDAMHEDNNLLFSTSDVAKILAFSKMVEQELGKKIEHENDTPEKEQSQEHGQDQEGKPMPEVGLTIPQRPNRLISQLPFWQPMRVFRLMKSRKTFRKTRQPANCRLLLKQKATTLWQSSPT